MSASYDLAVIGAGPGGIAAAAIAAEAGLRVCLVDDNLSPGGQIWRGLQTASAAKHPHGATFVHWSERLRRTGCTVFSGWQVVSNPTPRQLRIEQDGAARDLEYRNLIIATGARELFLPFPGWTLPGVTGVGGLQALVKSGLDLRDRKVVVAGTGPLLLAIAAGLAESSARIAGIYEQAPLARLLAFGISLAAFPGKLVEAARYRGKIARVPFRTDCWVLRAEGSSRVERVTLTNGRRQWTVECDWLACGFHLVPNLELPRLFGCAIKDGYVAVDSLLQSSVPGIACIGELTGIGGMEKAIAEGEVAALAAAGREAQASARAAHLVRHHRFVRSLDRAFRLRDELRTLAQPETIVCRCEDVAYARLAECASWREAKLHTRCGMGACQGRICGAAAQALFGWQVSGDRPPLFPAAVSAVAVAQKSTSGDVA